MTRTNALYFTVTVFATVGFGDITANAEAARLLVTGQMILDLIIIGVGARVIVGAITRGRHKTPAPHSPRDSAQRMTPALTLPGDADLRG